MTRDEYISALQSGLLTLAKNTAMKKLITLLPIFASGPLNYIALAVITKIATWFLSEGEVLAFESFIDLRTSAQGREFLTLLLENQKAQTSTTLSKLEKQNAEKNLIDIARKFIHLQS